MRKRSDKERLQDILDATIRIESYLGSANANQFARDLLRQDAVMRRLGIIGEAARNVSAKFQEQHDEITWSRMIEAQSKIMGAHFKTDVPMLWDTAMTDIPQLKKVVAKILKEMEG